MNVFWKRFLYSEIFLYLMWFATLLFVLVAAFVAANIRLHQSVKRAQLQGVELDYRKLIPPPIPPKENASYVIEDAVNAILDYNDSLLSESDPYAAKIQEIIDRNGPFQFSPENDLKTLRDSIRPYQVGVGVLLEGRSLENARYDVNYEETDIDEQTNPDINIRLKFANVLYASTLVHVYDGDVDRAYDTLDLLFRYSLWCSQETPNLLSKILGCRVAELGFGALQQLLNSAIPSKGIRTDIANVIETIRFTMSPDFGLRHETAYMYWLICEGADRVREMNEIVNSVVKPYVIVNQSVYVDFAASMLNQVECSSKEREALDDVRNRIPPWSVARTYVVNYKAALIKRDVLRSYIDLTLLVFALLDDLENRGAFPESLEPLVERLGKDRTLDPFSDEAYRYRKTEGGFVLYSVGPNFEDDGGKLQDASIIKSYDFDLTFSVDCNGSKKTDK